MQNTIKQVQELLKANPEWMERYANYATKILENQKILRTHKRLFHEWAPLYVYMNVAEAKSSLLYGLRYLGQDVAKIRVGVEKVTISTRGFEGKNSRDFGCIITLNNVEWKSVEAAKFRKYFSVNPNRTIGAGKSNEEHRMESLLLTEFSKKLGATKLIRNIQPVKLAGIARFQMPTPLGASDIKKLKYSGKNGGGIDIISRIGVSGATKLCIMEVKDENNSKETPAKVIQQGLMYATFIRELLRCGSGELWWQLFGFSRKLPVSLELYVTCVMPSNAHNDASFANTILKIGNDSFHLHYMYFKEKDNSLFNIETSLMKCITEAKH